jgi:HAD superfamily hydrolase (TIGR01509 family)
MTQPSTQPARRRLAYGPKALIFDFDGTLLDTETPEFYAWQTIYREHGSNLALADWLEGVGTWYAFDPYADLARKLGRDVDRAAIKQRLKTLHVDVLLEMQLRDGAVRLIHEAKARGLKLAVASSSSHKWVDGHLSRYDLLDQFDAVKCRDDVGEGRCKPHPDLYVAALTALGVQADEAVAFEDSLNGIRAAQAAGIFVIGIANEVTRHMQLGLANRLIDSFEDVSLDAFGKTNAPTSHESGR